MLEENPFKKNLSGISEEEKLRFVGPLLYSRYLYQVVIYMLATKYKKLLF